jgi:hypothetical protein
MIDAVIRRAPFKLPLPTRPTSTPNVSQERRPSGVPFLGARSRRWRRIPTRAVVTERPL